MLYQVTVERHGRGCGKVRVEAPEPILACEVAERRMAMAIDGTIAYLAAYFGSKVVEADDATPEWAR